METTKEARDNFIKAGSEIADELNYYLGAYGQYTIADIGACDGLSSVIYSKMFTNATIHAFEPLEKNIKQAKENFEEYGVSDKIRLHKYALSDKKGVQLFYTSKGQAPGVTDRETGNKSSSLLPPKDHIREHPWCGFDKEIVEVRTLDSFDIRPKFIHIDVQGAELMVFKGGKKTVLSTKVIWVEVANIELYKGQPLKQDIQRYLTSMGFIAIKDTCGRKKYGDMLWVKK